MTSMFAEGECIAREHGMKSLRIDTHERNLPLQGLGNQMRIYALRRHHTPL